MNSNWNNIQQQSQQQQQGHLGLGQLYSSVNCTPHQHHQTPVSNDFLLLGTSGASSSSSIQNGTESQNRKQHKSETPESRALRLKNQRIRTAMRRLNETDEERQKRLRDARIRSIQRRQNESSEERRIRLANQRYRTARKRLLEKSSKESGQEGGQEPQQQKQINPVKIEMEPTTIVCQVPQLGQSLTSLLTSKPQPSDNLPLFSPNSSAMPNHQQYLSTICPGNLEHLHQHPGSRPRPMETIEERDRRLFEQRLRTERRRQNETTEERMIRLEKQRLRTASRRRRKDDNSSGFNSNSNSSESNESSAAAAAIVPSMPLPMSANNSSRFGPSHLQTNFQNGVVSANPFMMNNFLIGGTGGGGGSGSVIQNRGVGGSGYQSIPEIYSMVLNAAASSSTSSAAASSSSLNHHQTTSSSSNPNFESPPPKQ